MILATSDDAFLILYFLPQRLKQILTCMEANRWNFAANSYVIEEI